MIRPDQYLAATSPVTAPQVNLNGTSRFELVDPRLDAREKIREAIVLLDRVTPNGRDYGGMDTPEYRTARDEHHARFQVLDAIREALHTEAEQILDQEGGL